MQHPGHVLPRESEPRSPVHGEARPLWYLRDETRNETDTATSPASCPSAQQPALIAGRYVTLGHYLLDNDPSIAALKATVWRDAPGLLKKAHETEDEIAAWQHLLTEDTA